VRLLRVQVKRLKRDLLLVVDYGLRAIIRRLDAIKARSNRREDD
jgi:hypothetical protein